MRLLEKLKGAPGSQPCAAVVVKLGRGREGGAGALLSASQLSLPRSRQFDRRNKPRALPGRSFYARMPATTGAFGRAVYERECFSLQGLGITLHRLRPESPFRITNPASVPWISRELETDRPTRRCTGRLTPPVTFERSTTA